jgi:hypothetical protein
LITVRENGEVKKITVIEAVITAQQALAISGKSAYAQKHIIESRARAEPAKQSTSRPR